MSPDKNDSEGGFYDSICSCTRCGHKSRHCFKLNCSCCEKDDHTAVMDGIEGLELKDKKEINCDKLGNQGLSIFYFKTISSTLQKEII